MDTADSTDDTQFELVDDLLDGLSLTPGERSRIEDRASDLLALDASLRDLRIAAGVLQKDVATAMGVSKSSVAQLEARGMADAKLSTLSRYFAGFGYQLNFTLTPLDA